MLRFLTCFIFSLSVFVIRADAQQDIQFSQYVFNGLILNPAYAGYKEVTNLNLVYRTQWTGIQGAPQTISASIDGLLHGEKMGLGFAVTEDQLGAQSSLNADISYSYRLLLGNYARLCFGIAGGVNQFTIDGTKLTTINSDRALSNLQSSTLGPDMKAGIFYTDEHYYGALSVTDLFAAYRSTDPSYLVIRRNRHYYLQTGALINLNENIRLKPSIIFKEDFHGPTNVDLNTFLLFSDRLWLGMSYQSSMKIFQNARLQHGLVSTDAISALVEYYVNERLRIGYSFDYSTTNLRNVSSGSHEISIGYSFQPRLTNAVCPRFF